MELCEVILRINRVRCALNMEPRVWFAQAEAQFEIWKITVDETKYYMYSQHWTRVLCSLARAFGKESGNFSRMLVSEC